MYKVAAYSVTAESTQLTIYMFTREIVTGIACVNIAALNTTQCRHSAVCWEESAGKILKS